MSAAVANALLLRKNKTPIQWTMYLDRAITSRYKRSKISSQSQRTVTMLKSATRYFFPVRVARWFVFKPKIQIWVNFGGSCNWRWLYILWTPGPFYGLFMYILWTFGIIHGNLVYFSRFGILYQEKSGNPAFLPFFIVCEVARLVKFSLLS
jgi:hypothetical protein